MGRQVSAHFYLNVENVVEPVVTGMGYELVDLQSSNGGRLLRLFIDKPGGIGVEDCAAVSRQLSRVFEVEGVDYDRLEVSSPGLDRPLRKASDFERFAGQRAEVRMRTPAEDGRRKYVGVLRGAAEGRVSLELDGKVVALEIADVDRAKLVPEL
jgi:ribosome maturation factor RimP